MSGTQYKRGDAPAILLPSDAGNMHAIITGRQAARRNSMGFTGTLKEQFNYAYGDFNAAGLDRKIAQKAIKKAYKYFDSIGGFS